MDFQRLIEFANGQAEMFVFPPATGLFGYIFDQVFGFMEPLVRPSLVLAAPTLSVEIHADNLASLFDFLHSLGFMASVIPIRLGQQPIGMA